MLHAPPIVTLAVTCRPFFDSGLLFSSPTDTAVKGFTPVRTALIGQGEGPHRENVAVSHRVSI